MDDLTPNVGAEPWDIPEEREHEEAIANDILASSYKVLPAIADWFEEQIKACDSVDNIDLTSNIDVTTQLFAYKELKRLLEEKYNEFKVYQFNG